MGNSRTRYMPASLGERRLLVRLMIGMAVFVWLVLIVSLLVVSQYSRSRLNFSTEASTSNLARSLENSISNSLTGIEVVMAGMEDTLLAMRNDGWRDNPEILRIMRSRSAITPLSRGLTLIDETGRTIVATHLANPLAVHDLSDREYFIHHRDNANQKLRISKPVQSKADRRWVSLASRRLQDRDGRFMGVLTASIDLADLAKRLDGYYLSKHGTLLVIDEAGNVLARRPNHDGLVGARIPTNYIPPENSGHGQVISPLDGRLRFFGFERSRHYGFLTVSSIDIEEFYAVWRQQLLMYGLISVVGSLLIALLTFHLVRHLRHHGELLTEIDRARGQAEEASRAKSSFLAGVSHELRTPLNAILGFSEVMAKRLLGRNAQGKYMEYAQDIHDSAQHLLSLIDDLLDVSRIESGHFELRLRTVSLPSLVETSLNLMRERVRENDVQARIDIPADFPKLFCDERALRQVMLNLISNAVKFTPIGGKLEVAASLTDTGEVEISVSDNGPGIPDDEREKMLAPFIRSNERGARRAEGTGLGLPISKKLIEAHGGSLRIEGAMGGGTRVVLTLPASRILLSDAPPPAP